MPVINIKVNRKIYKTRTRVGRGVGSGKGGQSGRGAKGQKARSGGNIAPYFEGGQMPLHRRLPKRGFKNTDKLYYKLVDLSDLSVFKEGSEVDIKSLLEKGIIKKENRPVKLLANGEFNVNSLKVSIHACSKTAKEKIEKLGGSVTLIPIKAPGKD